MAARTYVIWLIIALISGAAMAQSPQIKWAPDLATAKQASAQFKVPLLVHFYGDACVPCQTLEKNVLSNPEVIQVLNKFFICVSINGSRDRKTMSEFEVHSYPTDVFVSPTGDKLYQGICPQDLREYLATLERVAVMNRDYMAKAAAKQPNATLAQQPLLPPTLQNAAANVPSLPSPNNMPNMGPGSGNTNTPSFYTASGAAQAQQQLANGAASSNAVQTGPLNGNQQPPSIRGAVQNAATQLDAATSPYTNVAANAIPTINGARNAVAGAVPHLTKDVSNAMQSYAQMPSVDSSLPIPQLTDSTQLVNSTANRISATANDVANRVNSSVAQGQNAVNNIWSNSAAAVTKTTENPHYDPAIQASGLTENSHQSVLNQVASGASQFTGQLPTTPSQSAPQLQGAVTSWTQRPQMEQQTNQPIVRTVSSSQAQPAPEQIAALDGYCPVSLRGKQWRKGTAQFAVKHRGMVFWLADQACLESFMKQPDYFTPILMGCDPMILLQQGQMQSGSTQFGLFEDRVGPLFFSSAESKAEFLQDFPKNMAAVEAVLKQASSPR
ncbi:MAG: thioredoxin family protein [Pirellulales bacterium]